MHPEMANGNMAVFLSGTLSPGPSQEFAAPSAPAPAGRRGGKRARALVRRGRHLRRLLGAARRAG